MKNMRLNSDIPNPMTTSSIIHVPDFEYNELLRKSECHDDLLKALSAAQSALRSFQYGNASSDFAKEVADNCATALAKAGAA